MTAVVEEVHQGLGSCSFTLNRDAEVEAELIEGRHLLVWWGQELVYTGVFLSQTPGDMLVIKGRGLEWSLGQDEDGNVIRDREFTAGTNKLSNPDFALADLYWRTQEDTAWAFASGAASTSGTITKDDVLQSDESFEAEPGMQFRATCAVSRSSGSTGRLRLRTVYAGKFDTPNLLPDPTYSDPDNWLDESLFPSDTDLDGATMLIGPTTKHQLINNPDFESGSLSPWVAGGLGAVEVATDFYYSPTKSAKLPGGTDLEAELTTPTLPVIPGEQYAVEGFSYLNGLTTHPNDALWPLLLVTDPAFSGPYIVPGGTASSQMVKMSDLDHPWWTRFYEEFRMPDGIDEVVVYVRFFGHADAAGAQWWDHITLTQLENNRCVRRSDYFDVTPERSYEVNFPIGVEAGVFSGRLEMQVIYRCPAEASRPDIVQQLATTDIGPGTDRILNATFTPPSGYDNCFLRFHGIDVYGGSFVVGIGEVRETDDSTRVFDDVSAEDGSETLQIDTTAPTGTERVHWELVAETDANGWSADNADLHRIGVTAWTAANVVRELLKNQETDDPLVSEGTIHGSALVPYDQRPRNITTKKYLQQFSRAVMDPPREYRIHPDNTLDWGEADEIFTDRTDVVLTTDDAWVIGVPEVEKSAEHSLQKVVMIGSDRSSVGRRKQIIESEATNSAGGKVDWFGNPWTRTRIVQDSTADHIDYAAALARYIADQNNTQKQNLRLGLSDWKTLAKFDVGDWIYPYLPGVLEDVTPVEVDGRKLYPKRIRVAARTWRLGNDFRLELRRSDGSTLDLTDFVKWEDKTTADIEVGDLIPDFTSEARGTELLNRLRASSPR